MLELNFAKDEGTFYWVEESSTEDDFNSSLKETECSALSLVNLQHGMQKVNCSQMLKFYCIKGKIVFLIF